MPASHHRGPDPSPDRYTVDTYTVDSVLTDPPPRLQTRTGRRHRRPMPTRRSSVFHQARCRRGPGGHGGAAHTLVTGDELAKVTAAVKAKDSAVTVTRVQKDPDGSYDVL